MMMKTKRNLAYVVFGVAVAAATLALTAPAALANDYYVQDDRIQFDNFGGNPVCQEYQYQIRGALDAKGYHGGVVNSCEVIRSNGADHVFGLHMEDAVMPAYTTVRYTLRYGADGNEHGMQVAH